MIAGRRPVALAALALAFGTLGARPAPRPSTAPHPHVPLAAATVLANYEKALAALVRPHAIAFDYSVEQLGLRDIEQSHRVYRSGLNERDETVVVDGYTLARPAVRIIANRTYRYDISAVAPRRSAYRFVYAGKYGHGASFTYVFRTAPFAPAAFAVTGIEIDGERFLPSLVRFKLSGGDARGSGVLAYMSDGPYWIVRDAKVSAHLANHTLASEHITWGDYSFPTSLPASTFDAPNGHTNESGATADSAPNAP